jgi:hypothetical protein
MKRYKLKVLTGGGFTIDFEVIADYFQTQTSSSTSSGYYSFYVGESSNRKFVCSYPIDKTIILQTEDIE